MQPIRTSEDIKEAIGQEEYVKAMEKASDWAGHMPDGGYSEEQLKKMNAENENALYLLGLAMVGNL